MKSFSQFIKESEDVTKIEDILFLSSLGINEPIEDGKTVYISAVLNSSDYKNSKNYNMNNQIRVFGKIDTSFIPDYGNPLIRPAFAVDESNHSLIQWEEAAELLGLPLDGNKLIHSLFWNRCEEQLLTQNSLDIYGFN
jgi:hypothetical protein